MMDEYRATLVGQGVVELLGLVPLGKDKTDIRYHTTWGNKTAAGLGRCAERILNGTMPIVTVPEVDAQ